MTFEPLLWSHHPPHLESIAFSTEVGVQRKVVFVPQNGCTDIMEIPQRMYEELNRRQVEQLSAICLVEACNACRDSLCIGKKAPSIWLGAWSFYASCWNAVAAVVRSCVHCSTFSCHDFSHPHPSRRCHLHLDWLRPLALGSVVFSFPEISRGRLGTRCFSVWHLLDGSSCLWAGQPRILKLWGKQEKHHTFLLRNFAYFWMNFIVWSMPSRDSQAHPQGKQGTTESQLILWNFMNSLTIFARISIFFCNGPVVKGRMRVWHVVWHLSLQDVLRVVGVAYPWCGV